MSYLRRAAFTQSISRQRSATSFQLTVGRNHSHVLEQDQAGGLNDDFDWLLAVQGAHSSVTLRPPRVVGGFKGEVVGSHDMNTRCGIVEKLRRTGTGGNSVKGLKFRAHALDGIGRLFFGMARDFLGILESRTFSRITNWENSRKEKFQTR